VATFFENQDRRVIPNWRSFKKTVFLGELNSQTDANAAQNAPSLSIADYLETWQTTKTVAVAADLLSASVSNNISTELEVHTAAQFILDNPDKATASQVSLASSFQNRQLEAKTPSKIDRITVTDLEDLINPSPLHKKIQILKKNLEHFPCNPITYVDLARLYSILGLEDKAKRAMLIALHFGKHNRFVLRAAARLFAHYDDFEYAHDLIRKSPLALSDPWVLSTEIALASLRERNSRFIKHGVEMINSKDHSAFTISELASSIGTVELLNGTIKKSRLFFQKSLVDPNDNSLAQAEWAQNKEKDLNIEILPSSINYGFEASAISNYHSLDFKNALNDSVRWLVDMPFSKRPSVLGSHISAAMLNDHETAITFLRAGLASHPRDPHLINNIAYSLILVNKLEEADRYMNNLPPKSEIEASTNVCLTATSGLYFFRLGQLENGRLLYQKAIEDAKALNSRYFTLLALLNYTREEILIQSHYTEELMELVSKIPTNEEDIEIRKLKSDIIDLYKRKKG
jgi:tetratricopeptide (TPR) repeat protein